MSKKKTKNTQAKKAQKKQKREKYTKANKDALLRKRVNLSVNGLKLTIIDDNPLDGTPEACKAVKYVWSSANPVGLKSELPDIKKVRYGELQTDDGLTWSSKMLLHIEGEEEPIEFSRVADQTLQEAEQENMKLASIKMLELSIERPEAVLVKKVFVYEVVGERRLAREYEAVA